MNTPMNDNFTQICSEVGLNCENCTAETARHLAAVCQGLRGKAVGQLFVQIYPNSACAPMHKRFAAHYRAASAVGVATIPCAVEEPVSERREVMFARPRTMAAVA
jgi:hypothetical protein